MESYIAVYAYSDGVFAAVRYFQADDIQHAIEQACAMLAATMSM